MLLFSATLFAAWMYAQSPNLDSVRPAIEDYLKEELELDELRLGELSWYWAGFLWLHVDELDFTSKDRKLGFHNGSAAVRIPLASLFSGNIAPDRIRLSHGKLNIHISDAATPALTNQLILDNVTLNWAYADWQGELPAVYLTLDTANRSLHVTSASLNLSAQLDEDGLPRQLILQCSHTDWLPASLASQLHGKPEANIKLVRQDKRNWQFTASVASEQPLSIMPDSMHAWQLNRMDVDIGIQIKSGEDLRPEYIDVERIGVERIDVEQIEIKQIDIRRMDWSLADNSITAHGQWQDGKLNLKAESERLSMPIIWSWLRPLGGQDWADWLALMQHGTASQARAELALAWPDPVQNWPTMQAWESMQYRVQAELAEADIALGISEDFLQHTQARVDVNQDGLNATIVDAILPRKLGHTVGTLYIPWDTLELHISGTSRANVANLLQWFGPVDIAGWKWNNAKANSTFALLWDPSAEAPKQASATLHPDGVWNVSILELALQLSEGEVQWNQNTGLILKDMQISSEHLRASLSLQAAPTDNKWAITAFEARGDGELAALAAHFHLPLSNAAGTISSSLSYDGNWSGMLDMKDASWDHLLGSSKKTKEPFSLHYQGDLDLKAALPTIHLSKLSSRGNQLKLYGGSASINRDGLNMRLEKLHTPSFSGTLDIDVPFKDHSAWKIDVKARYLNRNALPDMLDHPEDMIDKRWLLRADISEFDWDESRMSGVHIKLSSDPGSIGVFAATQIHTAQMDIMDVDARFTLPGQGRVELRKFSASLEKQHLTMSATLSPEPDGGMRWRGFAELDGDFGHLMKLGDLSERFTGGEARILFSGQGIMLREQPWWKGLDGRLRLRVDNGRILEGGTLTTLLSAINLTKLPALLFGNRKDLSGPGIMYERLQMEAIMQNQDIRVRNVAMRSTAFDLVGHGSMDIDKATIDLYMIAKPLQNLDALLAKIPLLRDLLGGRSHSLVRKVYHMHGPFADAQVKAVKPEAAGLASAGIIEHLIGLPNAWFGSSEPEPDKQPAQ